MDIVIDKTRKKIEKIISDADFSPKVIKMIVTVSVILIIIGPTTTVTVPLALVALVKAKRFLSNRKDN